MNALHLYRACCGRGRTACCIGSVVLALQGWVHAAQSPTTAPSAVSGENVRGGMADKSREFRSALSGQPEPQDNGLGEDPLLHVAEGMAVIVGDLTGLQTGEPVQTKQGEVVARLDTLIAALEQQCKGGGGGGANPTRPLASSVRAGGPGGQGDMIDPRQGEKQWAALPSKQREQILQSRTEGFPPGYETILQSYYRRLSQEQVEPTDTAGALSNPPKPVGP